MLKNLFIQAIVFILIFNFISLLKEQGMLDGEIITPATKTQFLLPSVTGEFIDISENSKKTVFYFFAPWCQICHLSIDNLQSQYQKNENINVIAVALDYDSKQEVDAFVAKHMLTFPIVYGNHAVKQHFKIKGYPSYYVVDTGNQVLSKSLGYSTELGIYLRTLL